MSFRINVYVLLFGLLQAQIWCCPDGWTSHNRSCYALLREGYSWFDAKVACDVLDATLVEIDSAEENRYLAGMLHSHGVPAAWIGLEDILEENVFRWVSTKQQPEQYFWDGGEPDDQNSAEDCVAMWPTAEWFDANCETIQKPCICEMPAPSEEIIG